MLNFKSGVTAREAAAAMKGSLLYEGVKRITGASIDSRSTVPGDLFVAVKGENTDGHRYIDSAAISGAAAILIEDSSVDLTKVQRHDCSVILVPDTVKALGLLAKEHKAQCPAFTVAVTGSVGKTTTRQFIYAVLSQKHNAHKTEGNFNNELGLPLTLIKLQEEHGAAVLELGMGQKGEISYLTDIVRPDIAVITNIGTSHIEYLGSREGIRDAKMEIAEGLKPGGKLILNGDEPLLSGIPHAIYVSLHNENSDFRAGHIRYTNEGMCFDAICPDRVIPECRIPTLGEHTVLDALFAVACGYYEGIADTDIKAGMLSFEGVGMRQNITVHNGVTFILDYYNASPESIKASLSVTKHLAEDNDGRTVAVIGSVLELGEQSETLHRSIGSFAAKLGCDLFFAFGKDACLAAEQAVTEGMSGDAVFSFPDISDVTEIVDAVANRIRPTDCVLLKASHSIHMERVADRLLAR